MKLAAVLLGLLSACPLTASAQEPNAYRVLATSKTSTMQNEMQEAGDAGFRFASVMGGETAVGGKARLAEKKSCVCWSAIFRSPIL